MLRLARFRIIAAESLVEYFDGGDQGRTIERSGLYYFFTIEQKRFRPFTVEYYRGPKHGNVLLRGLGCPVTWSSCIHVSLYMKKQ